MSATPAHRGKVTYPPKRQAEAQALLNIKELLLALFTSVGLVAVILNLPGLFSALIR